MILQGFISIERMTRDDQVVTDILSLQLKYKFLLWESPCRQVQTKRNVGTWVVCTRLVFLASLFHPFDVRLGLTSMSTMALSII